MLAIVIRSVVVSAVMPCVAMAQFDPTMHRESALEVLTRGLRRPVRLDTMAHWENIPAPQAVTYNALKRVITIYFKLPVERADSAASLVFHKRVVARATLAGQPMSRWVRCSSGLTGDYADSWRVSLAYAGFVDSTSASDSRLGVAVHATASNVEGTSNATVLCASTGVLEREISRKVREVASVQ